MFAFRAFDRHLTFVSLVIVCSAAISCAECYRILGIFPHSGKSHFDVFEPLFLQLAKRGHNVTVISYFPQKNPPPNYHDLSLFGTTPVLTNVIPFGMMGGGTFARLYHLFELAYFTGHACENSLKSQAFNEFIQRQEKYDVVITEFFTPHCLIGLIQNTGGSLVGLTSSWTMPWVNDYFANPDNPAYLPSIFMDCSDRMNFWERTLNLIFYVWTRGIYKVFMYWPANKEAKEKIDASLPDLNEFFYNASLILTNVHHSLHPSKPLMPGVIEVGGMHIGEEKRLPPVSNF
ncbi:UDP-glucosyltransferase [Holotrichia oblita]|uniref:UDP-glucosyltransferase n=1 Tax=Holotrichia oblita TaxID=644536 RepID=A0ACB9T861_HOLOL|nr:UDP-glucosyltransferase [Holotrichia oblita]